MLNLHFVRQRDVQRDDLIEGGRLKTQTYLKISSIWYFLKEIIRAQLKDFRGKLQCPMTELVKEKQLLNI